MRLPSQYEPPPFAPNRTNMETDRRKEQIAVKNDDTLFEKLWYPSRLNGYHLAAFILAAVGLAVAVARMMAAG